jgi:NTP pyrophosphatase (non-canonical NTP hydrolase)
LGFDVQSKNMDILNNLESKINDGIATFEELDDVCCQLIFFANQGDPKLTEKANELMERLKPEWSSVAFQNWMIEVTLC